MGKYSIKELEQLSGIKAHTIRIWEKRYAIINPKRTDTNIRFYSDEDLKRIINVSLLNTNGFKISRIAEMSEHEIIQKVLEISATKNDNSVHINQLVLAMVNEAVRCLEDGVLRSARDGDVGAVMGIGFPPFRGGPFWYLDQQGARSLHGREDRLRLAHPAQSDLSLGEFTREHRAAQYAVGPDRLHGVGRARRDVAAGRRSVLEDPTIAPDAGVQESGHRAHGHLGPA